MKTILLIPLGAALLGVSSCTTTAPVGNVEGLERQAPVTPDSNALGDAINARNAVDYSNSRGYGGHRGYGGGYGRYGY